MFHSDVTAFKGRQIQRNPHEPRCVKINRITFNSLDDIRLAASAGVLEGGRGAVNLKLIAPVGVMPHIAVFCINAFIIPLTGIPIIVATILARFDCIL